jgi:uncharacterized protein
VDAVFIHYRVDPAVLQPHVPFELDLYEGQAYVTLVAFTQQNLRPTTGGRLAALLSRPVGCHAFLNVRTYVRHRGEAGIYFIAEWIPNRLSTLLGPPLYGLPFRLGKLTYATGAEGAAGRPITGTVRAHGASREAGTLAFEARPAPGTSGPARGLDEFLVERYTAYTSRGAGKKRVLRRFRIAHAPWPQVRAEVRVSDASLPHLAGPWWPQARYAGANYSPGVMDVAIGPPETLDAERRVRDNIGGHFPSPGTPDRPTLFAWAPARRCAGGGQSRGVPPRADRRSVSAV